MLKVGFKRLTDDAKLPIKAHPTDSGFDLFASEGVVIGPGETKVIKTGIAMELPLGYEAQVRPRSGVTSKTKLRVQLGTIDTDYTGEISIIVDNIEDHPMGNTSRYVHFCDGTEIRQNKEVADGTYYIRMYDKLAQLVIQPIPITESYEVDVLSDTMRGSKGFGSSGYN